VAAQADLAAIKCSKGKRRVRAVTPEQAAAADWLHEGTHFARYLRIVRIIRLFLLALALLWLGVAVLRVFATFNRPDAMAGAIGYALVPTLLFIILASIGRSPTGGKEAQRRAGHE
jgi:hypothetical protein